MVSASLDGRASVRLGGTSYGGGAVESNRMHDCFNIRFLFPDHVRGTAPSKLLECWNAAGNHGVIALL